MRNVFNKIIKVSFFLLLANASAFAQGWIYNGAALVAVGAGGTPATVPNIGIGLSNPSASFHTIGSLRFENLLANNTANRMLVTDASGNVGWRNINISGGSGWELTGNTITGSNYMGSNNALPVYFRANASSSNPGQALLTTQGSFIVDGVNNSNICVSKGNLVAGIGNRLGAGTGSCLVTGWENDLTRAGGANIVAGQRNIVTNGAGKSVALGWVNTIRDANQFAIGVGVDLAAPYSGGFGIDLIATGDRSFVFGSGTGWGSKLTNNIPNSIMFGVTSTPTLLIKDQQVGIGTTYPTASLHATGTVRFEGLPAGTGNILVIDGAGNLMVSSKTALKGEDGATMAALLQQIDDLTHRLDDQAQRLDNQTQQIAELRSLLVKQGGQSANTTDVSRLLQNVPNPSGSNTTIGYYMPETASSGFINIYDTKGQLIKNFPLRAKGNNSISINGSELQPGAYFYNMVVDGKLVDSKNMVVGLN